MLFNSLRKNDDNNLYKTVYQLDNVMIKHSRIVYGLIGLIGDLGGVF